MRADREGRDRGQTTMVCSWNLAGCGYTYNPSKYSAAVEYLASELVPDVAVLQEMRLPAEIPGYNVFEGPGATAWCSAVAVRFGITANSCDLPAGPLTAPGFAGYVAWADVGLEALGTVRVTSVHSPTGALKGAVEADVEEAASRSGGMWNSDVIFTLLAAALRSEPNWLVAGDWNESPFLWDKLHNSTLCREFFERAAGAGWVDCARLHHPDHDLPTWIGKGTPYQNDHVFVSPALGGRITSCQIDAVAAERQLSDHAPLVVTLSADRRVQ
jgi:exonuclease III